MLEFKDEGTFVELSYHVPAYNPRALPQERFRISSQISFNDLLNELKAYGGVYGECAVINYSFSLGDGCLYEPPLTNNSYCIFPRNPCFDSLIYSLENINDIHIHTLDVLSAYFKLIKPLEFQQQNIQKRKQKRNYRKRTRVPRGIRNEVFKRDDYTCVQCGAKKGDKKSDGTIVSIEIDHIKPIAKGGTDEMSNLQTLCKDCNRNKNDVYQKVR